MNRALLALALAVALTACLPFAQFARDLMATSDGATLSYAFRTPTTDPGLRFDPGGRPALGVILDATGTNLTLLSAPATATCVLDDDRRGLNCRLGLVLEPVTVHLTGSGVLGFATYRREGISTPYRVFTP